MISLYQSLQMKITNNKKLLQLVKYGISGVINSIIGYLVFIIFLHLFHFRPEYANAADYAITLVVAFFLNKKFVFEESQYSGYTIPRFIIAFLISFGANQVVLILCYQGLNIIPEVAQIFAMITYTVLFYLLNKYFVFKDS